MTEPDAFHRALAALDVPEDETRVAEAVLAAVRLGHDLKLDGVLGDPSVRIWGCIRCASAVVWAPGGAPYDGAARWSCAESLRGDLAQGFELEPEARAWLAEHDRTGAGRG